MRALRIVLSILILAIASLASAMPASAQACRDSGVEARVFPSIVIFPRPDVNHFLAGQITLAVPVTVNVDSPIWHVAQWHVCVSTPVSTLGNGKSIGDLQFYNDSTGNWESLTNGYKVIARASSVLQRTFFIQIRVLLNWETDGPGLYGPTPLSFRVSR